MSPRAVVKRRTGGVWRTLSGGSPSLSVPDAPQVVAAVAGDGQATVQWTVPDSGGSALTGYTVRRYPGGATQAASGSATTATVAGLSNGSNYTFTIQALNALGGGPESAASVTVTPHSSGSVPAFPTSANQVGIAGVGLTNADLTTYDCAVRGPSIAGGSYNKVRFINIVAPGLTLMANNTVFTKCKFEGPTNWPNPVVGTRYLFSPNTNTAGATGHVFDDCEISGGGVMSTTSYNASATTPAKPFPVSGNAAQNPFRSGMAYTLRRCDIRRFEHLLQPTGNPVGTAILVESCYLHEFILVQYQNDVTHVDGMQVAGTGVQDLTIQYCNFDIYNPAGASDQFQVANAASGGIFGGFPLVGGVAVAVLTNLDIHHNRINGGQRGYILGKASYNPSLSTYLKSAANAKIRNNVFGLQHLAARDTIGTAQDGTQIAWTDNTWEVSGTTRGGSAVLAGQLIP